MPRTVLTRNVPDTFRLRPGGPLAWPAGRALLSMAVPLGVLLAIGRLDLLPGAVFGALTSVHCRSEPHPRQARALAVIAGGMVLAVLIGCLIGAFGAGQPWQEPVALLATALGGAIATAAATAVKIGPPGGLIFSFAIGACAHLPVRPGELPWHVLTVALSAAFAWAVTTAGGIAAGLGPHRRAVLAALEATAGVLEDRSDLTRRHRAAVAIEHAWNTVAVVGRRHRDTPRHRELVHAVDTCEAVLSQDAPAITADDVRGLAGDLRSGRGLAHGPAPVVPPTPVSRWWTIRDVLRAALRPHRAKSWLVPYAMRIALAALLAGTAADLLGTGHAYWAAVSAVSVMQATSTAASVPRMLQRVGGTVFGVLAAIAVLSADPPVWVLIVLLAALQWCAEMTVTINYAIGLLFATQVALLVSAIGTPADPGALGWSRFSATLLGAAIAVLVAWALPNRAWLERVHDAMARVRKLTAARPLQPAKLRTALIELQEAYDVAAGEVRPAKLPTEELLTLSHRAYATLDTAR